MKQWLFGQDICQWLFEASGWCLDCFCLIWDGASGWVSSWSPQVNVLYNAALQIPQLKASFPCPQSLHTAQRRLTCMICFVMGLRVCFLELSHRGKKRKQSSLLDSQGIHPRVKSTSSEAKTSAVFFLQPLKDHHMSWKSSRPFKKHGERSGAL